MEETSTAETKAGELPLPADLAVGPPKDDFLVRVRVIPAYPTDKPATLARVELLFGARVPLLYGNALRGFFIRQSKDGVLFVQVPAAWHGKGQGFPFLIPEIGLGPEGNFHTTEAILGVFRRWAETPLGKAALADRARTAARASANAAIAQAEQ